MPSAGPVCQHPPPGFWSIEAPASALSFKLACCEIRVRPDRLKPVVPVIAEGAAGSAAAANTVSDAGVLGWLVGVVAALDRASTANSAAVGVTGGVRCRVMIAVLVDRLVAASVSAAIGDTGGVLWTAIVAAFVVTLVDGPAAPVVCFFPPIALGKSGVGSASLGDCCARTAVDPMSLSTVANVASARGPAAPVICFFPPIVLGKSGAGSARLGDRCTNSVVGTMPLPTVVFACTSIKWPGAGRVFLADFGSISMGTAVCPMGSVVVIVVVVFIVARGCTDPILSAGSGGIGV